MRTANWCNSDNYIRIPTSNEVNGMVQAPQIRGCTAFQCEKGIGATVCSKQRFSNSTIAERGAKINTVQYIGIAADEPLRIARHIDKPNMVLPLVQADWEEDMCGLWCKLSDCLSPTYEHGYRDGCWFCHNQGIDQLRRLRKNYPDLWALLMKWDLDSPVSFHADGHTVHDFDRRFQLEDEGLIYSDERFKWSMLDEELNYRWF